MLMTVFLLAQAGVPLTSGFFAKFYVVVAAVDAGSTSLAVIAMLSAVISAFLYLRITVSLYMSDADDEVPAGPRLRIPVGAGLALAACVVATLLFGVWPGSIAEAARDAVPVLTAFG
jgi:NADH-quinone oxidoreductase subunit N